MMEGEAWFRQMTRTSEANSFIVENCTIKTERGITIQVNDYAMYNGTYLVCKTLFVDGKELVTNKIYGEIRFVYKNDGTIKVYE